MGLLHCLAGSISGTVIVCYTRALRKQPYFSRPWEHVIFGVAGGAWMADFILRSEKFYEDWAEKVSPRPPPRRTPPLRILISSPPPRSSFARRWLGTAASSTRNIAGCSVRSMPTTSPRTPRPPAEDANGAGARLRVGA